MIVNAGFILTDEEKTGVDRNVVIQRDAEKESIQRVSNKEVFGKMETKMSQNQKESFRIYYIIISPF